MRILCILALFGASLWITLKHGIIIERIKLSSFKTEHISLRVDGGIVASVDRLDIVDSQATDSKSNPGLKIISQRRILKEI